MRKNLNKYVIPFAVLGSISGLVASGIAAAAPAASLRDSQVVIHAYAIPSDPPNDIRVAPGGGRVLTPVMLFTPASGENIHSPAIIMIGRGPGSNPARQDEPTLWAAKRLAARGYTVLSIQTHMDRGYPLFPFEETAFEIDAALNSLEMRGYEDFVLAGHSYGAVAAAHYAANEEDKTLDKEGTRRVRAMVMLDPITELREYPGLDMSKSFDTLMAKAKAEYATGHNGYLKSRTVEVGGGPGEGARDWLGSGFFVAPAEAFLDYWGEQAEQRNWGDYTRNPVNTLVLAHDGNPTVSIAKLNALDAANRYRKTTLQRYPGADFTAADQARVVDQMVDFMTAQGVGPRPQVTEKVVNITAADGRILPGIVYMPAKVDPNKPALLLAHGRSGDIIQSSTHWMGWRFAQKGYVVLAPSLRISGAAGIATGTREQTVEDMTGWMNELQSLGYTKVVATGHSNGGIWISDYKVLSGDKRIKGMIYFAPTANVATWEERSANAAQMAQLAEAKVAVESGQGTAKVFGLQSATLTYDSLRPESVSHPERLAKITEPGLFIIGGNDKIFQRPGTKDRLVKAYAGKLDVITYEGGSHGLRESKDRIADDVDAWLRKTIR